MNDLESHPFKVEIPRLMMPLLLPVLAIEDNAVSESGDEPGIGDSDVAGQLSPIDDLRGLKYLPKLDDSLGNISDKRWWWGDTKRGKGYRQHVYSRVDL
jgi:hypothetical protein